ncbi:MAG TPA: ribonuclease P protein component, partial [Candidatus Dormibacteraeota bacterium]|nr:ribonuclease P protein component [Candidatus Dormibacteraeota bacterium]
RCGQRHFSQSLTAFYLLRAEPEPMETRSLGEAARGEAARGEAARNLGSRVGITVGRVMGKATVRNRIKRRVRAAVTENLERLTRPVDVVINPKKVALDMEFARLSAEVARAFEVVEQKAALGSNKGDQSSGRSAKPERLTARKP